MQSEIKTNIEIIQYFMKIKVTDITQIILGFDGFTNKYKFYVTVSLGDNNGEIRTVEMDDTNYNYKHYKLRNKLDLSKIIDLHPDAKEIYKEFYKSSIWELKNYDYVIIYIGMRKGIQYTLDNLIFEKGTKYLITSNNWNKIVSKYGGGKNCIVKNF